jgi:YidC/Oxa1 family membrane protein insertase
MSTESGPGKGLFNIFPSFGSKPITPDETIATSDAVSAGNNGNDTSVNDLECTDIGQLETLITDSTTEHVSSFEPTWWPSDQALLLLNWVNDMAGLPCYAYTIAGTTLALRLVLFPLFIKAQRNSSRMAHCQPELKKLMEQMEKEGKRVDQAAQLRYTQQVKALFKKYDCSFGGSLIAPLVSAPIFMSFFFGLRNAAEIFPDLLATGGMLWFPDLTIPDPYVIMPVLSAGTFLLMTEVGKDQMMASDPVRGRTMVNVFRALAVAMVPLTMNFNSAVFVYWTTNNSFSLLQSILLKQKFTKKAFGIWDPPKPVPGQEPKNIFDEVKNLMNKKEKEVNALAKERIKAHNEIVEQQKKVKKALMEKDRGNMMK